MEYRRYAPCPRSLQASGSTRTPRRPRTSTPRSSPTVGSTTSAALPADFPGGHKGDVLTVNWTMSGQPFTGINGGPEFKFSEAISFVDRLRRPGRGRPLLGRAHRRRRRARAVRLAEGPLRAVVAGRPASAQRAARRRRSRGRPAGDGGDAPDGQARRRRPRGGLPRRDGRREPLTPAPRSALKLSAGRRAAPCRPARRRSRSASRPRRR